jgi:hypothetical protein
MTTRTCGPITIRRDSESTTLEIDLQRPAGELALLSLLGLILWLFAR